MQFSSKKAFLWSVLPLSGINYEGLQPKSLDEYPIPPKNYVQAFGIPVTAENNTEGNPNLRLIKFTLSTLEGPFRSAGTALRPFYPWSIYDFKWKILNLDNVNNPKIGFYVRNYIPELMNDISKYYLLPTSLGPALFEGICGRFSATNMSEMYVITEGNCAVELKVRIHNPEVYDLPQPKYQIPWFYKYDCEKVASVEFADGNGTLYTKPVPKYIEKSLKMIEFLKTYAVIIDITPDSSNLLLNTAFSKLNATEPFLVETYEDLPFQFFNRFIFVNSSDIYDMITSSLPINKKDYLSQGNYWHIVPQNFNESNADVRIKVAITFTIRYTNQVAPVIFRIPINLEIALGHYIASRFDYEAGNSIVNKQTFMLNTRLPLTDIDITGTVDMGTNPGNFGCRVYDYSRLRITEASWVSVQFIMKKLQIMYYVV